MYASEIWHIYTIEHLEVHKHISQENVTLDMVALEQESLMIPRTNEDKISATYQLNKHWSWIGHTIKKEEQEIGRKEKQRNTWHREIN